MFGCPLSCSLGTRDLGAISLSVGGAWSPPYIIVRRYQLVENINLP